MRNNCAGYNFYIKTYFDFYGFYIHIIYNELI